MEYIRTYSSPKIMIDRAELSVRRSEAEPGPLTRRTPQMILGRPNARIWACTVVVTVAVTVAHVGMMKTSTSWPSAR